MNYAETFDQFASRLSGTDIALYAGAGLILWVLFKDKLSPVQQLVGSVVDKVKNMNGSKSVSPVAVVVPSVKPVVTSKEDMFFKLVVSWKQTRDLAVECGCVEAIKVADQMFPYLSPVVCTKEVNKEEVK
jgi:hypothetical protein